MVDRLTVDAEALAAIVSILAVLASERILRTGQEKIVLLSRSPPV